MALPRILLAVPLVAAGALVPAIGHPPARAAAGILGMTHEGFDRKEVTLGCGQTLTMRNTSRYVHIIGPGRDGLLSPDATGAVRGRALLQTDDVLTTGPWRTPGVHYLTCSVHPEMTVEVVVEGCCCKAAGA
jgi:plastocyanin